MPRWLQRWSKSPARADPTATAAASSTTSTSTTALPPRKTFPSGIKLLYDAESSVVDIVFIHGLVGDREKSWTAKNAATSWPQALLPSKVPNARVLTFGYDAQVTDWRGMVSKNNIGNHAMNLLTSIATYREGDNTNERSIIFVCHSLGGLVCEDALLAARYRPERHLQNVLYRTRGIIFLGTPHHGSGLAQLAEKLAKAIGLLKQTNPQILAVLERDSEVLARIQDSFHAMLRLRDHNVLQTIDITCFYEELPLPGVGVVVPSHSAVLPGYTSIGIRRNHMDMIKFESVDDPGFTAIAGELRRWAKALDVPSNVERPRATTLQQEQVVQMAQSLSLSEPSGIRSNPSSYQARNHQTQEHRESQPQNNVDVRHRSPQPSPLAQTPLNGQRNQTEPPQSSASLWSAPRAQSVPTTSQIPGKTPGGIKVAGAGGDVNIGNSEHSFSGNFYGGVHVSQGNPFAAFLPQANVGLSERALLKAAGKADVNEILKLIHAGTNIDAINEEGESALTVAISRQHTNVVKLLIDNGATMDRSGYLVKKPLHVAVETGNVNLVRSVLDNGADIDETTAIGSPLTVAVKAGHESIVALLLARNANANIASSQLTPMFFAITSRKEHMVSMLLKYGAEAHNLHPNLTRVISILSLQCRTLLKDWASQAYHEHVKALRGASWDQVQVETALFSALRCALEHGHREVHSLFMDIAGEFAIPVDRKYRF